MPTFSTTADGFEMRTGNPAESIHSVLIQEPVSSGWDATSAFRFTEYVGVELDGSFSAAGADGWPTAGTITAIRFYVLGTPGDPGTRQLLYTASDASWHAADFLAASDGIFTLFDFVTAGDDVLIGGGGDDDLVGGAGDDLYIASSAFDWTWEEADAGFDIVQSSTSYTLRANVERLELTGNDAISGGGNELNNELVGNDAANWLKGEDGDDYLEGRAGDDILEGRKGRDTIFGNEGDDAMTGGSLDDWLAGGRGSDLMLGGANNDRLSGGAGRDRLNGGTGDDRLTGGAGRDVFVFRKDWGHDVITDFDTSPGTGDLISLDADVFADVAEVFSRASDTSDGVLIAKGGVSILLLGVSLAELNGDDFEIVARPDAGSQASDWIL